MRFWERIRRRFTRHRREGRRKVGSQGKDETAHDTCDSVQALHSGVCEVMLHPLASVRKATTPSFTDWVTVPLTNHNALSALINGRRCVLYVDSGTTSPMMAHTIAAKLGLLKKVSYTKDYDLQFFTSKVRANLKVVERVDVQLACGVELNCTFFVLPESILDGLPGILLDNSTLRQAGAVQEFTASTCFLHFPTRKPPRTVKDRDSQFVMDVKLRQSLLRSKKFNIHVDTGAQFFYVSPQCLETQLHMPRTPQCVSLTLDKGVVVSSGAVRVAGTNTFDFVVGKEMLARYRCILDFASNSLYFHVKERMFLLKLRKSHIV